MDVVVLSVDVSRSDGAANERKSRRMNTSDGSKSKVKHIVSSSTSTSRESPPTSSLTTARYCLDQTLGCRSASRHKVEMYLHSLNRLQVQEERLEPLAAATGGEIEIVKQIADFEEQILRLEAPSPSSILSFRSLSFFSRRNSRLETILGRIHAAAETADIPTIVQEMMDPIQGGLSTVVQEMGIQALLALTLSSQDNKLHVVNCSGISAVVAAMRNHTHDATLQRQGAALLLNLPFFFNKKSTDSDEDTSVFSSHHNNRTITSLRDDSLTIGGKKSTSTRKTTTTTTSFLDLHVVQMLVQEGALHCVLVATEENLLQVVMDLAGDESDNYARVFAKAQIPALCQLLMDLYGYRFPTNDNGGTNGFVTTTTTAASSLPRLGLRQRHGQNKKVGQELSFIRRSLASLVDDPTIAPDTLVSFLQCKTRD
jgi:hypothetical protein